MPYCIQAPSHGPIQSLQHDHVSPTHDSLNVFNGLTHSIQRFKYSLSGLTFFVNVKSYDKVFMNNIYT